MYFYSCGCTSLWILATPAIVFPDPNSCVYTLNGSWYLTLYFSGMWTFSSRSRLTHPKASAPKLSFFAAYTLETQALPNLEGHTADGQNPALPIIRNIP